MSSKAAPILSEKVQQLSLFLYTIRKKWGRILVSIAALVFLKMVTLKNNLLFTEISTAKPFCTECRHRHLGTEKNWNDLKTIYKRV